MKARTIVPLFFSVVILHASILTTWLAGQSVTTGDIVGVVTDPSGAVILNSAVTLISKERGFTQQNTTQSNGVYRFPLLAPGNYEITATAAGFELSTRVVQVFIGQTSPCDLKLSIGPAKTTVGVTNEAPLLQTGADLATTFNADQIRNLPNPGNDLTNVAQTAPGAVMGTQGGFGNFSTYGLPATSNLFTLDGMNANDPVVSTNMSGASNLLLGYNEVQEAVVVNNGYSGRYGGFAGANVNYITKSGSNSFHGNAAYWWNGRILNANNWFNKDVPPGTPVIPRPFVNANQYAASFGGPIKKNTLFFFVDYEGLRLVLPSTTLNLIPSPQFEAATIANLTQTGLSQSVPFYNQMFDLWNSAPGAERAAHGIPQVGDPTGCNGFTGLGSNVPCALSFISNPANSTREYLLGTRLDLKLGQKDNLFFHLRENQGLQGTYADPINPVFDVQSSQPIYQAQVSETHIVNPQAVNLLIISARYGSFVKQPKNLTSAIATFPTTLFLGDGTFTGLGGIDYRVPFGDRDTSFQILDDFSLSRGKHNLKFGFSFNRVDTSDHNFGLFLRGLVLPFTVDDCFSGGATGSLLVQNFPSSQTKPLARYAIGTYAEDEFRVAPSLTLMLSLRVDHNSNPVCHRNCFARLAAPFDELNHDVGIPYDQAIHIGLHQAFPAFTNLSWQPRFGFTWTPPRWKDTVLSGGLGLFMDTLPGAMLSDLFANPPLLNSFTVFFNNLSPAEPSNLFRDAANSNEAFTSGFANGGTLDSISQADPSFTPPNITNTVSAKAPVYQEWDLQFQHAFGASASFILKYVGNHGVHIPVYFSGVNAFCPPDPLGPCPKGFIGLPASAPDPRFSVVTEVRTAGVSNYNGLVASFRRRVRQGLQIQANFTWSHALDEVSNGGVLAFNFGSAGSLLNPQDSNNLRKYNYGNADYDVRHYFNANYLWEIPYKFGPAIILDGWQVSGTIFARSGLPYTVLDSTSTNALANFGYRGSVFANVVDGSSPACTSPKRACLDESDFSSPISQVPGSFGLQRRNQFYGPGFVDTDLAVIKNSRIPGWEEAKIGVGVQFFNLFNHPNFDQPNADIGSPGLFGFITNTVGPPTSILGANLGGDASHRLIQLTARITF